MSRPGHHRRPRPGARARRRLHRPSEPPATPHARRRQAVRGAAAAIPEWLDTIGDFIKRNCFAGVVGAVLELGKYAGSIATSDATGISSVSPTSVCPGTKLTISGSGFGATQPADTKVYVPSGGGCREATVTRWTDTAIDVTLPAGVSAGCVGFVHAGTSNFGGLQKVTGELTTCMGAVGEIWGRGFGKVGTPDRDLPAVPPGWPEPHPVRRPPVDQRVPLHARAQRAGRDAGAVVERRERDQHHDRRGRRQRPGARAARGLAAARRLAHAEPRHRIRAGARHLPDDREQRVRDRDGRRAARDDRDADARDRPHRGRAVDPEGRQLGAVDREPPHRGAGVRRQRHHRRLRLGEGAEPRRGGEASRWWRSASPAEEPSAAAPRGPAARRRPRRTATCSRTRSTSTSRSPPATAPCASTRSPSGGEIPRQPPQTSATGVVDVAFTPKGSQELLPMLIADPSSTGTDADDGRLLRRLQRPRRARRTPSRSGTAASPSTRRCRSRSGRPRASSRAQLVAARGEDRDDDLHVPEHAGGRHPLRDRAVRRLVPVGRDGAAARSA